MCTSAVYCNVDPCRVPVCPKKGVGYATNIYHCRGTSWYTSLQANRYIIWQVTYLPVGYEPLHLSHSVLNYIVVLYLLLSAACEINRHT